MRGPRDRVRSTTRLPAALREELGIEDQKRPRKVSSVTARKQARREKRKRGPEPKKRPNEQHATRAPTTVPRPQRPAAHTKPAAQIKDKEKQERPSKTPKEEFRTIVDPITGKKRRVESKKGSSALAALAREPDAPQAAKRKLTQAEKDEEDEIAWLEHQLYGRRGKRTATEGDDLDFLLDDMDRFQAGMHDDDADDTSNINFNSDNDSQGEEDGDEEGADDIDLDDDSEEINSDDNVDLEEDSEDDLDENVDLEEDSEDDSDDNIDLGESEDDSTNLGDGASQDTPGSSLPSSKYVPPALRARTAEAALTEQKLRRHVNGLLNRLGDGNVDTIVTELGGLYRTYARGDVSAMVTRLILDTISARTNLTDAIVVLYATLVVAMHRIVGQEFGASFLQTTIERFVAAYGPLVAGTEDEAKARECSNLILLLCHLFNLRLLAAGLMYDMVKLLVGSDFSAIVPGLAPDHSVSETDIELLLRIVQTSGSQLRHDDAAALRSIVELTQQRVNASTSAGSSRARFMLEAMADAKQRPKKAVVSDTLQRMIKYISGLDKRHTLRAHGALQVGLKDLQDAEKRGRWWLVGAAWTGRDSSDTPAQEPEPQVEMSEDEIDIGALARTQGMNTDARRSAFSVLMSSQDYAEAAQSLMELRMNDVQRREIVRVVLHCLGNERTYNPYYALVGEKLAEQPSMRVTMQYALWDFFREIGESRVGGEKVVHDDDNDGGSSSDWLTGAPRQRLENMARAYGWWFARNALNMSALKTVDFTALHTSGIYFVQQLLMHSLLGTQTKVPIVTARTRAALAANVTSANREAVHTLIVRGITGNPALAQGLYVFIATNLRKSHLRELVGDDAVVFERLKWAVGVAHDACKV
ncbi:suppressor of glycerol defect [Malassezia cuniculi]|uniref:Suppressor of glycerol defect n=1 Tax=Malassezia cuniculi TaxID=948313 RepID=A0AAF0EP07_9BASI|nr:suppressor of glycerol defect [Malassezia cuniculi]